MSIIGKELAFVELASKELGFTRAEKKHMINLANRGCILSPQLWEMVVEKVSGLKFVDRSGYDFDDGSEAKTGSCTVQMQKSTGYDMVKGQITNVSGKNGYIRVALYNDWTNRIDFFLLPPGYGCSSYTHEKCPQAQIKFSYSRRNDSYSNGLEIYRVYDLKDVCSKKSCKKAA